MLSLITLNDSEGAAHVLHEDSAASHRLAKSATGLKGLAPVRQSHRVRPQAHGTINETRYSEGQLITLDLEVFSQVSIEAAMEELDAVTKVLQETLDYGDALLKWTVGETGQKLQRMVRLDSDVEPVLQEAAAFIPFHVALFAQDPRAYSQTLTEATGGTITGSEPENAWLKATASPALAVDSGHIYWCNGEHIARATVAGGSIELTWIAAGATVNGLAINSEHIYWCTNEHIGRATIAGGTVETAWITPGGGLYNKSVAVDSEYVYWRVSSGEYDGHLGRAKLAGTGVEKKWKTIYGLVGGSGLAVDSTYIYWTENNSIGRCLRSGGSIEENWIPTIGGFAPAVAVTASHIYWSVYGGNVIGRAAIAGTEVERAFQSGAEEPQGLAVGSEHVYWANEKTGYIGRTAGTELNGSPQGGALTISQAGNRPTPMTFKIHGPITNPSIVRTSDGSRIALAGEIASGNYIEINTAERMMKLNGLSSAFSLLNAKDTNWPAFEAPPNPKTVEYELTGTTATAAYMEAIYRSAYA